MKFNSFEEAIAVFQKAPEGSDLRKEALEYIVVHAPPDLRKILEEGFKRFFPDLKPTHYDENGEPYFDVAYLAKYFGVSEEEILDRAAKSETRLLVEGKMHRVQ